jgi:hypothetical protein
VRYPYVRWQRTLRRLAIRHRKPYVARHTSVSWNLMMGRNPLLVAPEDGHRLTTMLSVYAAWAEGAVESDITAIREAMDRRDWSGPRTGRVLPTTWPAALGAIWQQICHWPTPVRSQVTEITGEFWWKGRDSNLDTGISRNQDGALPVGY